MDSVACTCPCREGLLY